MAETAVARLDAPMDLEALGMNRQGPYDVVAHAEGASIYRDIGGRGSLNGRRNGGGGG